MKAESEEHSFNQSFCEYLEYYLTQALSESHDREVQRFWCDGVSFDPVPDSQLSEKHVNDKRHIVTKAWLGIDGQDEYKMVIHFGKYALRRYARSSSIKGCLPPFEEAGWLLVDQERRIAELRLN